MGKMEISQENQTLRSEGFLGPSLLNEKFSLN